MALPQMGVEALFLIEKFQRNAKRYDKILGQSEKAGKKLADSTAKSSAQMARSYDQLIKKSGELQRAMSEMSSKRQANLVGGLEQAFSKLGSAAGIDIGIFDRLVGSGESIGTAFQKATTSVSGLGTGAGGAAAGAATLGAAVAGIGIVLGVAIAGTKAFISVLKESIASYQENADELRRFQLQLGGSTEEVSRLLQAAKLTGTQMNHLAAGVGMFEKKMVDFELRVAVGSEESHEFERALKVLGVEVKDNDGNLRALNDIMLDTADRFQELGPGVTTTGLAMNLFGRSGRQMLPFLMEGADGLERFTEIAEKTGSVLTSKDVKGAYEFQQSLTELDMSVEGVKNTLARAFIPGLEEVSRWLSDVVQRGNEVVASLLSVSSAILVVVDTLFKTRNPLASAIEGVKTYDAMSKHLTGTLTEQEKVEEELLAIRQQATQDLARAEMAREEVLGKVEKLEEQSYERRAAAELQFSRQMEDIMRGRGRELEDAAIQEARKREDLWRQHQRRLDDILDDYNKRKKDREESNRSKLDAFLEKADLMREKLLNRHLERMDAIRERFIFAADEAARRNDAVALLRAMRQRAMEEKLEKKKYENRRHELEKDIARRLKELQDSFKKQEAEDKKRLDDAIARAKKAYARQLEDLAIALKRQTQDRQRAWTRQEEDYDLSLRRRDEDTTRWYDKERGKLDTQLGIIEGRMKKAQDTRLATYEGHLKDIEIATLDHFENMGAIYRDWLRGQNTPLPPTARLTPNAPPVHPRAEGGIDVVRKPTMFLAGEGGSPEIHAWAPMSQGVHHTFDRMGMDISGVSSATEAQLAPLMIGMLQKMVRQIR